MRNCLRLLFSSFLFLISTSIIHGQSEQGPCHEDIQKFCKDIQPGQGRIVACLKAHEGELSSACKERREQIKGMAKDIHAACEDDVERLCSGIKPGEGRIRACLREHSDHVSAECKEKISQAKSQRKMKRQK